jgi:hypothetical protein
MGLGLFAYLIFGGRSPAPKPRLSMEGGNGPAFEKPISLGDAYQRYGASFEPGAYLIRASAVKVLRVTNESDLAAESVRAEVTHSTHPLVKCPTPLRWWHDNGIVADLAPRSSAFVQIGLKLLLGVSLPNGGSREWPRSVDFADLRDATLQITVWAPGAIGSTQGFRFESSYPAGYSPPSDDLRLPLLSPVSAKDNSP